MKIISYYTTLTKKKIIFFFLSILCLFPILEVTILSKVLFVFFVSAICFNFRKGLESLKSNSGKHLFIFILFFCFLFFTVFYSGDNEEALKTITRQLSFVLFPLIFFYFLRLTEKELFFLSKIFVFANIISVVFLMWHIHKSVSIIDVIKINFDFRSVVSKSPYKDWHPTYVGLFILTSIFFLIENSFKRKKKMTLLLNCFLIIIFSGFLFVLNSRIIFYAFVLLTPFFILIKLKTIKERIIFLVFLTPLIFILYSILMNNFALNYRLVLQIEKIYHWIVKGEMLTIGVDVRYYINKCSYEMFLKKPWFGYGVGDVKYILSNCYLDNEFHDLYFKKFNSHNTYFYLLLAGGLFTLISYLCLIINNFYVSIKSKNHLYTIILIMLVIVFLTENIFVRLNGILFFTIINVLMYYYSKLLRKAK